MTSRTIELVALAVFALIVGLTIHAWLVAQDNQRHLQSALAAQKQVIDEANSRQRVRDAALNNTLAEIEKLKNATQSSQQLVDQLQKYLALPQPILLVKGGLSPSPIPDKRPSSITRPSGLSAGTALAQPAKGKPYDSAVSQSTQPAGRPSVAQGSQQEPSVTRDSSQSPSNSLQAYSRSNPSGTLLQADQPFVSATVQSPLSTIPGKPCLDSSECTAEIPATDLKSLYNYVQDCRACDAELSVAKQNASDDATKIAALTRERDAAITASKGGSFLRRLRRNILWLSVGAAIGYAAHR